MKKKDLINKLLEDDWCENIKNYEFYKDKCFLYLAPRYICIKIMKDKKHFNWGYLYLYHTNYSKLNYKTFIYKTKPCFHCDATDITQCDGCENL